MTCREHQTECALRASHALEAYCHPTSDTADDKMVDLMTDLGHHADERGIDFLDCCARAIAAWSAERRAIDTPDDIPRVVIHIGGGP